MRTLSAIAIIPLPLMMAACRQDMQDQPKYKPLGANRFFADGRDARPIPAGTIARDELNDTDAFHTGEANGAFLDTIPLIINSNLLHRGQERFDIYCSPCHGRTGDGNGMVAQRGVKIPADFHTDRLRSSAARLHIPGDQERLRSYGRLRGPDSGERSFAHAQTLPLGEMPPELQSPAAVAAGQQTVKGANKPRPFLAGIRPREFTPMERSLLVIFAAHAGCDHRGRPMRGPYTSYRGRELPVHLHGAHTARSV